MPPKGSKGNSKVRTVADLKKQKNQKKSVEKADEVSKETDMSLVKDVSGKAEGESVKDIKKPKIVKDVSDKAEGESVKDTKKPKIVKDGSDKAEGESVKDTKKPKVVKDGSDEAEGASVKGMKKHKIDKDGSDEPEGGSAKGMKKPKIDKSAAFDANNFLEDKNFAECMKQLRTSSYAEAAVDLTADFTANMDKIQKKNKALKLEYAALENEHKALEIKCQALKDGLAEAVTHIGNSVESAKRSEARAMETSPQITVKIEPTSNGKDPI